MSENETSNHSEIKELTQQIESLNKRLKLIEATIGISSSENLTQSDIQKQDSVPDPITKQNHHGESFLESRIGEYGLAWLGNIVLLFGITFLTGYLHTLGLSGLSTLLGFVSVAVIFILARTLRKSYTHMGFVFNLNGHFLLYYFTMRLHFFSTTPIVQNGSIALIMLTALLTVQIYVAIRSKSEVLFGLILILMLFTAIASDSIHFLLSMVTLTAGISVYFLFRFEWKGAIILALILVYFSFLFWFLNNPIMGHPIRVIESHNFGFLYLFIIAGLYSLLALANQNARITEFYVFGVVFLNGLSFSVILGLFVIQFFSTNYIAIFTVITMFCLIYSILLKSFSAWKFTSAFYALYGFVAMSISLYGLYDLPNVFLLLSVQSLLVVSIALWFRNKIIVIMNALLFIILLIFYLASSDPNDGVNFSFAFVILITARILNWKKQRLEIKTDLIRNIYLLTGFVLVLYTLFHWVPRQYVTLSWTFAALLYFVLSVVLKNVKYRYMALGTMIATTLYLFIIDLANIELVYRVIAFMFLAIISIGASIYYTRRKRNLELKSNNG